jgi:drug/metabolite transporter (DMT)-like permease
MSKGVKFMLAASFSFATMNVFVKLVPHIPAVEIILFRSVVSLIISVGLLHMQKVSVWGTNKPILLGRGIAGAISLLLYFDLLQRIPLATASALGYLAPIFSSILGIFLVREKVGTWQWFFFLLSFCGVIVIQGFDPRIETIHIVMGVTASFFMGLAYNFIRMLKTSEHPLVIIFYFPLVMLPISGVWSGIVWVQPAGMDWVYLILVGVLTQFAQFFMTKAYQSDEINKVSIVNYVGIIYALSYGFILFGERFNLMTHIGITLVVSGVVANIVFKRK